MLADLGDTLVNTNEIRKISIEYVPEQCDKPWRPWEVIIRMADDKQGTLVSPCYRAGRQSEFGEVTLRFTGR